MEQDLVYLVWKDVKTGNKFKVAKLYKENGTFYFKYILENVKEAQQNGFKLLIAFPQINALYDNPRLFAVFAHSSISNAPFFFNDICFKAFKN